MFVDIDDFKSAIAVENMLTPYKKGRLSSDKISRLPKEHITPEVCMEVLKSTNYARNIKDMLSCVVEIPISEQAQFKDVVLAAFTQREQPQAVVELGQKLAVDGGYYKEFAQAMKLEKGEFLLSSPQVSRGLATEQYKLMHRNFQKYHKLVCLNDKAVSLVAAENLPPFVDFSRCLKVDISSCDLKNLRQLLLRDDIELNLNNVQNVPAFLDVSPCAAVDLGRVDLAPIKQLNFRQGAEVVLESAENLPKNPDFSHCSLVNLNYCDLGDVKNLKFAPDADVYLDGAYNYCGDLDFTACGELSLYEFDLEYVGCVRFKNQKQLDESGLLITDDWQGKILFADKSSQIKSASKIAAKAKGGR